MIKVNLLRNQTARARKTLATPKMSRMGLISAVIFFLAAGTMSIWSYRVHRQVAAAGEKRAHLLNRDSHMQKLRKEIEKYRKMKLRHQSRIDLIERLKKSQADPVLLLNAVIQSIPRNGNLWLISLAQKSDEVSIAGFAQRTEAIPELMNNLAASGIFDAVGLEEIETREEASRFSLLCTSAKKTQVESKNGR